MLWLIIQESGFILKNVGFFNASKWNVPNPLYDFYIQLSRLSKNSLFFND